MSNEPEITKDQMQEFIAIGAEHGHTFDADLNLERVLTEQEMLGLRDEVLTLIKEKFHAEGTYLVCNDCDTVVTWVTKHRKERHGDDIQVWKLPEKLTGDELW